MPDHTHIIDIPIRINAATNKRQHWAAAAREARRVRMCAKWLTQKAMPNLPLLAKRCCKIYIDLVRIGKRKLDDDNLATAFKHIRDGVADAIGIDDGSDIYSWRYSQKIGKTYGVQIRLRLKGMDQ